MTRTLPLLAALALAAPAVAQDAPADTSMTEMAPMPADSTMSDSTATIERDPARSAELAAEANALAAAGNYEAAIDQYDLGILYDEANVDNVFGRARALAQMKRYDDAVAGYEATIPLAQAAERTAVVTAARKEMRQIREGLEQQAAAQQSVADIQATVSEATGLLQAPDVPPANAERALGLLNQAVEAGYDPAFAAFYYAKAYNVLDRGAEAVPHAQIAVDASEGEADRSAYYIQLGLAHMNAGNDADARAAFESAKAGAWSTWADHYLGQMDSEAEAGG